MDNILVILAIILLILLAIFLFVWFDTANAMAIVSQLLHTL